MRPLHSHKLSKTGLALLLVLFTGFFSVSGGMRAYIATQNSQTQMYEILEEKSYLVKTEKGRRLHHKRQQPLLLLTQGHQPEEVTPFYLSTRFIAPTPEWASPPPLLRAPPRIA
jgi:hypothetical protein